MSRIFKLLFFCIICNNYLSAQYCNESHRFSEVAYFSTDEIETTTDITYGVVEDWQGDTLALQYDMFAPSANSDFLSKRPAIVLLHGGSFLGGNRTSLRRTCKAFAQRGFVAFSISYRLGWVSETQRLEAAYRASQDTRAALRHIFNCIDDYGVDPDWVFLGGQSAGAIAALNTVYIDQAEWNDFLPSLENDLGGLNTSGNTLTNQYQIQAIFNNWGATVRTFMQPEELIPTISFHGEDDLVVPINSGSGLDGSRPIHELLTDNGVCAELLAKPNTGHGFYKNRIGERFRVSRASCFFKSLFCGNCTSLYTTDSIPPNCANIVSTKAPRNLPEIVVSPNPFIDSFKVTGIPEQVQLRLFDNRGALVYQSTESEVIIPPYLPAGIYFLRIRTTDRWRFVKLIKSDISQ